MPRETMDYPEYQTDMPCATCGTTITEYVNPCCYCGKHYCDKHLKARSPTICAGCWERIKGTDPNVVEPIRFTSKGRVLDDPI